MERCKEKDGQQRPFTSHFWCRQCRRDFESKAKWVRHIGTAYTL